ncbi:MAG TPA: dockerin type I repeat-containing protein [Dehalococcoidia bacterium]|nr:dockerin type I repeat-containing protein [Dehalococcoidia bacterium]
MSKVPKWHVKAVYMVFALALVVSLSGAFVVAVAPTSAQGPDEYNTLRIYGKCGEDAAFPYTDYQAPFAPQSSEAPPKDFIQWNPAYMYHLDSASNGVFGNFFTEIKANNADANEKVHLRQWYVPKYEEPAGWVFADQSIVKSPDLVKEYTYLLLAPSSNNPIFGNPGKTRFVFPIADQNQEQTGLDSYDMNGDYPDAGDPSRGADLTFIQAIGMTDTLAAECPDQDGLWPPTNQWIDNQINVQWVDFNTDLFLASAGDTIRFLDHRADITAVTTSPASVTLDLYYSGNAADELLFSGLIVPLDKTLSAGRHQPDVAVEDLTTMGAPSPAHPNNNPPSESGKFICGTSKLKLVKSPWYLQVSSAAGGSAYIVVGRLITEGESFFVDGAEYDVAMLHTVWDAAGSTLNEVKGEILGVQANPGNLVFGPIDIANHAGATSAYFADCSGAGAAPDKNDVSAYVNGAGASVASINPATGMVTLTVAPIAGQKVTLDYCYNTEAFKYITIRNPIPKFDDVQLLGLSITKESIEDCYDTPAIPMLPPFNMQHDIIDDTNIPDAFTFIDPADPLHPQHCPIPDVQLPDNLADASDLNSDYGFVAGNTSWGKFQNDDRPTYDDTLVMVSCSANMSNNVFMWVNTAGDGYGDNSFLPFTLNSIDDRWIGKDSGQFPTGVAAIVECFEQEDKEPRFDTNLLEEKFTEPNPTPGPEEWEWKNIETLPYLYTEMKLPEQPDITDPANNDDGDYILVSSWMTEDSTDIWSVNASNAVRMKFVYDAHVDKINSADIYVNDASYNRLYNDEDSNSQTVIDAASIRVYGKCNLSAAFPYTDYQGPFAPQSDEAPIKDFIQWNPAYMDHNDLAANGIYGDFFKGITVSNGDGNEKVHLRQWYVPKYTEPSGIVWYQPQPADCIKSPDIVKEYTYTLLDAMNDPKPGLPGHTTFVLPISDSSNEQPGLDDYDVNGDGLADLVFLETVSAVDTGDQDDDDALWPPEDMTEGYSCVPGLVTVDNQIPEGTNWIDISTGMLHVEVGDVVRFMDHALKIDQIMVGSIGVTLYYIGNEADQSLTAALNIPLEWTLASGRDSYNVEDLRADTAATGEPSPSYPPSQSERFVEGASQLSLVTEPWYCQLRSVTATEANIVVGRLITESGSFFVDAAEYEIAKLYTPIEPSSDAGTWGTGYGLKYITIRNGLPKVNDVTIASPSIIKTGVPPCYEWPCESAALIPFLPPFNMQHDMIDDVNIPDAFSFIDMSDTHSPQPCPMPDVQLPDNVWNSTVYQDMDGATGVQAWGNITNDDRALADDTLVMLTCGSEGVLPMFSWLAAPDGFGDISFLPYDMNTIAERKIVDVAATKECWKDEAKEPRFDTNLLEEKFHESGLIELWKWKNIETLPWDYTEFVLPALPDITDPTAGVSADDGDYILVSSFLTEDSTSTVLGAGAVRVKFYHDFAYSPEYKTGLYVNTRGATCDLEGDVNGDDLINSADLQLIAQHIVGTITLTGDPYQAADVNDSGTVNSADLQLMAQYLVGTIPSFPGGLCIP